MSAGDPYREPAENGPSGSAPGNAALDARIIESREKQQKVIDLRRRGMSFGGIAKEMSSNGTTISKAQVHKLFKAWLDSEPVQGADEHRAELVESARARKRRAERLLTDCERDWKGASLSRRNVIVRMIATQQIEIDRADTQLAKLLGAYAPTKHQVTGPDDGPIEVRQQVTQDEILKRIERVAENQKRGVDGKDMLDEPTGSTDPAPPLEDAETPPATETTPAPSPEDTGEQPAPTGALLDELEEEIAQDDEDDEDIDGGQ